MTAKTRPVEYGGITWKVVPGSRREQLLLRFIEQDRKLHPSAGVFVSDFGVHVVDVDHDGWRDFVVLGIGVAVGAVPLAVAWWLL